MAKPDYRTIHAALQNARTKFGAAENQTAKLLDLFQGLVFGARGESTAQLVVAKTHGEAAAAADALAALLVGDDFILLKDTLASLGNRLADVRARTTAVDTALAKFGPPQLTAQPPTAADNDAAKLKTADLLSADHAVMELLANTAALFQTFECHSFGCGGSWWRRCLGAMGDGNAGNVVGGVAIFLCIFSLIAWLASTVADGKLLLALAQVEIARGLLTLLVGVVTIFIGLIIVAGMWLGDGDAESEKKFARSKEIFALLMSVLGTILGFYFGSEKSGAAREAALGVTAPVVSRSVGAPANGMIATTISGGRPPYLYAIVSTNPNLSVTNLAAPGGIIFHNFSNVPAGQTLAFELVVQDAVTNHVSTKGQVLAGP